MRHARRELWFEVPERRAYLDITPQVGEFVARSASRRTLSSTGRTKRQRKLEARRRREFQRELEHRRAAGEQVVAFVGPKTKTTELQSAFGEPLDTDYARRLEKARVFLREPPPG